MTIALMWKASWVSPRGCPISVNANFWMSKCVRFPIFADFGHFCKGPLGQNRLIDVENAWIFQPKTAVPAISWSGVWLLCANEGFCPEMANHERSKDRPKTLAIIFVWTGMALSLEMESRGSCSEIRKKSCTIACECYCDRSCALVCKGR